MQFLNEEQQRRAKAEADLPPLPPLLAQILAETRAKQLAAKEGREYVPERKPAGDGNASDGEAQPPSGPLLLEGPSAGLVVQGTNVPERQPGDSDSDSDAEPEAPLGPLDPARCRVHGPGFSGGAAGQPVKLTLTARDANGKRIREGGAMLLVMVEPPRAPGQEEEPDAIEAEVTDHGDGTYSAVYTVPAKGNYQLHIEVDGEPVGDSPYPVFFSAAKLVTESGATAAAGAAAAPGQPAQGAQPASGAQLPAPVTTSAGIQVVTAQSIKAAQAQTQGQLGAAAAAGDMGASVALAAGFPAGAAAQNSLGADMVRSGMTFPVIDAEQLQRMVVVGGVSPLATPDALKSVFSLAGAIVNAQLAPMGTGIAFVTFSSAAEAANALTMGGASMMGQPLKVELATEAKKAADAAMAAHNPYAALQAQQLAHFQMLQQQQAALAQQVATMRAAQRTGVQLPLDQRIVLKKPEANGSERRRSRSRSREREHGSRRRSRSRDRERGSRRRSRSRERERGSRRERSRSRDRKRSHRSRSRERGSRHKEHKHKHHKHHKRSHRSKEREDRKDEKAAGGDKMEVDAAAAAAAQQPAAAADGNKDDLEALLDEFEG
ncbi:RNA recognition motif-containing isoform 1 [Chlorella sorokiniana]|uniref:RNA recognition motif-containing isoform 1 n=1 Tax=Chlorella sorokiniana TaxID=3076 RepID=A0A2P6TUE4_CHLSO|nr:RNA recognition motif-containing isoform 1 [Chlorella sorokiniana]|eukprot:PRW57698.1 RNA recognition motif-containing isoform 1 [Chlorella sorokiniana]